MQQINIRNQQSINAEKKERVNNNNSNNNNKCFKKEKKKKSLTQQNFMIQKENERNDCLSNVKINILTIGIYFLTSYRME
jgi:hypothetical protein